MKKLVLLSLCILLGGGAFAFYDFCESPQDYNTCKESFDFITEYWTDIPNYHPENIKYQDNSNKHRNKKPIVKKSSDTEQTEIKQD